MVARGAVVVSGVAAFAKGAATGCLCAEECGRRQANACGAGDALALGEWREV